MRALADVLAAALLVAGVGFTLLAGVGVVRFPGAYARMHAATKATSLGVALVLLGAALRMPSLGDAAKLLAVVAFQFFTAPIASHMVGRAAHRDGLPMAVPTGVDELRDARERADGEPGRSAGASDRDAGEPGA